MVALFFQGKKEAWGGKGEKAAVVAMTHQAEGLIQPYFKKFKKI